MIGSRSLWVPLLALIGALLIGGCAGGLGALVGTALCALALLLHGCDDENERCDDYPACVDGELTTEQLCCPEGVACNFGRTPPKTCDDGSCVQFRELCPEELPPQGGDGGSADAGGDSGAEMCEQDAGSEGCGNAP